MGIVILAFIFVLLNVLWMLCKYKKENRLLAEKVERLQADLIERTIIQDPAMQGIMEYLRTAKMLEPRDEAELTRNVIMEMNAGKTLSHQETNKVVGFDYNQDDCACRIDLKKEE